MEECVDGEYQDLQVAGRRLRARASSFGRDPVLAERVSGMSDEEIWLLNRGGLTSRRSTRAYHDAVRHTGSPR